MKKKGLRIKFQYPVLIFWRGWRWPDSLWTRKRYYDQ